LIFLRRHDWKRWKEYRHARSITSQTYDENKAMEIVAILPDFLLEAQALLKALKERKNPQHKDKVVRSNAVAIDRLRLAHDAQHDPDH